MIQITVNGEQFAAKLRKGSLHRNLWACAQNIGLLLPASARSLSLHYERDHNNGKLNITGTYTNGATWQVDMEPEGWLFYRATPPRLAALIITAACMQRLHQQALLHGLEPVYEVDP